MGAERASFRQCSSGSSRQRPSIGDPSRVVPDTPVTVLPPGLLPELSALRLESRDLPTGASRGGLQDAGAFFRTDPALGG